MSFISKLFRRKDLPLSSGSGEGKTSGQLISEITAGANLVDGRQTWELAEEKKHDIEHMKQCCDAELRTMEIAGVIAAPYYFERVAVLSRKVRDYQQEIHYCERYIRLIEQYYAEHGTDGIADVRKGPRFRAILARLSKARGLLAKSGQGK